MVWREYFRKEVVEYTRGHGFERLHCFFIKAPITHIYQGTVNKREDR
jgi:hypothetical protein